MANLDSMNVAASSGRGAAKIIYGIALTSSAGGAVTVRIGDEVAASASVYVEDDTWPEVDFENIGNVTDEDESVWLDQSAVEISTDSESDTDSDGTEPADDASEHQYTAYEVAADNVDETETLNTSWEDELPTDSSAAQVEEMPDTSCTEPADTDSGDDANDPPTAEVVD